MKRHDIWAVTACLQFKDGELLDKSKPFKTYYIEAPTASKAIKKLEKDFSCCNVTLYGKPIETIATDEEYSKEQ